MKLYHFTFIGHLPTMLGLPFADGPAEGERGITPSIKDADVMTANQPVVWLTSRDSLKPTADDLAWMQLAQAKGLYSKEEAENYAELGCIGDRTLRLTVDLSNSRRLRHYGTWVRENGTGALMSACLSPSALTDWWIYFGTVQPDRIIGVERTDAPHRNDAERLVWNAMKRGWGWADETTETLADTTEKVE